MTFLVTFVKRDPQHTCMSGNEEQLLYGISQPGVQYCSLLQACAAAPDISTYEQHTVTSQPKKDRIKTRHNRSTLSVFTICRGLLNSSLLSPCRHSSSTFLVAYESTIGSLWVSHIHVHSITLLCVLLWTVPWTLPWAVHFEKRRRSR